MLIPDLVQTGSPECDVLYVVVNFNLVLRKEIANWYYWKQGSLFETLIYDFSVCVSGNITAHRNTETETKMDGSIK